MGRAIVSTPMGAEGILARPGVDMLMARTAAEFAASVLHLLDDPEQRRSLGDSARELVTTRYAWDNLLPVLDTIYRSER
jgi:polysaccharide biosynthesis protein PslH